MKVGFIGTGSMGSLLIYALIQSGALEPRQIAASNRTPSKVRQLSLRYPGLHESQSNRETVIRSNIIFLCVKPLEFKHVIDDILPVVNPNHIIVSITSPVQLRHLESSLPCKVSKVIPSVTHQVGSGASLCIHGERMTNEDRAVLEGLLSHIGRPYQVDEACTRITSDFSSCGPAFISFFLEQWIESAVKLTDIKRADACALAGEMLLGTGKLLTEGGYTPQELQARVAVPGGITAQALALLRVNLNGVFDSLIQTTHDKYDEDLLKLDELFKAGEINRQQY
ncbi:MULTISPECIES: late competence protein ComER [Paenibacillus]|uniref:Pyrroline-5-carboxylate reductase n=1 Tax=Paenibacillus pabuli TaxID=1472 RepID=A0A855Y348_9BACL|nr:MULTISPECIES: late competence protein ComER [Paenibacillus]PWW43168.1 competence protein ComER [Paenibacillus pabuli]PXW09075.1 competence protein ComER [Paenibacillus taichungensis]QLG39230.1 late competence protein ComER [Paenibacillus sp. E222]RAJ03267.1 competence protein ComER [Paenibacillus pabuli]SEO17748.1 competence protein ComER [Paenibacillus sp. OK076]